MEYIRVDKYCLNCQKVQEHERNNWGFYYCSKCSYVSHDQIKEDYDNLRKTL